MIQSDWTRWWIKEAPHHQYYKRSIPVQKIAIWSVVSFSDIWENHPARYTSCASLHRWYYCHRKVRRRTSWEARGGSITPGESWICLKRSKCEFMLPSLEFLGHTISKKRLQPTKKKVEAVHKSPAPTNLTQLKSFLGLINYYCKFLPNLLSLHCTDYCRKEWPGNGTRSNRMHLSLPRGSNHRSCSHSLWPNKKYYPGMWCLTTWPGSSAVT